MGAPPSADYFDQPPATPGLDALAPPGSPAFVPSVIDRIRHTHPTLPIDPVILHSVLLCILAAAGPGNARSSSSLLVLRTALDDVPVVQNLTSLLLTHAFGYPTHRHRVASGSARTPAAFISSLFFAARGSRDRERHSTHKPRRPSTVRSRTFPAAPPPGTPSSAPPPALPLPVPAGRDSGFDTDADSVPSPTAPFATRPVPVRPHSDPLATGVGADADAVSALSLLRAPELPHALAVSGLEHASVPCQRALLEILQERLIPPDLVEANLASHAPVGGWRLPDDFFCVYVCPFDAYERPRMHRSLLDKFALSATVTISTSIRQAYTSYLATHPQPLSTPQLPSPPPPLSPLSLQPDHSHSQPSFPPHFLPRLRSLTTTRTHADPRLALFTSRIFSAARLHPDLDASLLTARAVKDAEALARAHRVLGRAELGGDLIEQAAAAMDEGDESMVEVDGDDDGDDARQVRVRLWDDGASAFSNDPKDGGGTTGTGASASDSVAFEPVWLAGEDQGFALDLSEADIGKIAPRVLSHRLRVRDGPADEVLSSLVFPACERGGVSSAAADGVAIHRQTVKDILVQLFKDL